MFFKKLKVLSQRLLPIIIFLILWEIIVRFYITYIPIPTVSEVFGALIDMAISGTLYKHSLISLQRIFCGYLLAAIIALPLGFALGSFKTFETYFDPLLQAFRQVPLFAWMPILVIICGVSELSKILLILFAAIWHILLNTVSAVKNVDPFIIKSARSLGTSRWNIFRRVILPSSIPDIFAGLRLASTDAILALLVAEMLGGKTGIGSLIINDECHGGPEHVMVYSIVVFMTIIGVISNYTLITIERRLCTWKEDIKNEII